MQRLAEQGHLMRFHGGVRLPSSTTENIGYVQRPLLNDEAKRAIAREVAKAIPNGCSLILNIGTTTEAIARELMHQGLRVITNNLNVAAILADNPDCRESSSRAAWCARATTASWARRRSISSASSAWTSA